MTVFLVSVVGWDTETALLVTTTRAAAEAYILHHPWKTNLVITESPFATTTAEAIAVAL